MDNPVLISSDSEGEIDTKSKIRTPLKRRFEASSSHSVQEEHDSSDDDEEDDSTDGDEEHDSTDYNDDYGPFGRTGDDEEHSSSDDDSVAGNGKGSPEEIAVKAEVLKDDDSSSSSEEWVTVVGFSKNDIKLVLRKFEKYGETLDHVRIPGDNWMHILYQNRSDAQKVLTKSWIQINRKLLVGVKPVDPIQRKTLNKPTQQVADRIQKAHQERLCLLHRCESVFFLLGATGDVYNVRLSATSLCSCPDRLIPCKHILFVLLRVLEVSVNDPWVWRKTLRECQLTRLFNTPTSPKILAGSHVHERFLHLFSTKSRLGSSTKEMYAEDRVSDCGAGVCDSVGHAKCMIYRKPSGAPFCASCGSRWNEDQEREYLNLASYMSEDGMD
ncbi:hypothetical protein MKW98_008867 [Papaver atlanticum]|uniref:Uncharacterized protein n=1 Tax=Papaver atlanticum TaxID=357466 RepID=A0AAD4T512_9MAGN|nr:hypothetical protein MKW98_008867 [Papaver atlanticum]